MEPEKQRVNEAELEWLTERSGDGRAVRFRKKLSAAAGGRALGCSLYRVPPGVKGWPRHYHTANEEALYVLAGEGTLVLGEERLRLRAGDYVALPADPGLAHKIVNDSAAELSFLCVSTMSHPDVIVYPDSRKVGVFAGSPPGGAPAPGMLRSFLSLDGEVDYWKDE